ncbi:hypothetical protein ZEAMMB73_Zm00001d047301 [Zea mays]|uniref:Uncharacterized protein n=1 Tax=Zea mays TaxID=4577 RepID=A0A1D6P8G9_MAIZE|nr:hypothetical protein ZEAMMB73_Zm00001d047301 [Zea mays]AQL06118.1 hypothetical protein ZEAMMB73_Zm00001d047301 [Zea mays]AQL06120.1 hypothetical protein ZEAMMB73_Zm00001d047301 [Zea mays]AQL06121.1 hypothetical protein ZEAMMB73_Zm00001d047301 [Zea mays]
MLAGGSSYLATLGHWSFSNHSLNSQEAPSRRSLSPILLPRRWILLPSSSSRSHTGPTIACGTPSSVRKTTGRKLNCRKEKEDI